MREVEIDAGVMARHFKRQRLRERAEGVDAVRFALHLNKARHQLVAAPCHWADVAKFAVTEVLPGLRVVEFALKPDFDSCDAVFVGLGALGVEGDVVSACRTAIARIQGRISKRARVPGFEIIARQWVGPWKLCIISSDDGVEQ